MTDPAEGAPKRAKPRDAAEASGRKVRRSAPLANLEVRVLLAAFVVHMRSSGEDEILRFALDGAIRDDGDHRALFKRLVLEFARGRDEYLLASATWANWDDNDAVNTFSQHVLRCSEDDFPLYGDLAGIVAMARKAKRDGDQVAKAVLNNLGFRRSPGFWAAGARSIRIVRHKRLAEPTPSHLSIVADDMDILKANRCGILKGNIEETATVRGGSRLRPQAEELPVILLKEEEGKRRLYSVDLRTMRETQTDRTLEAVYDGTESVMICDEFGRPNCLLLLDFVGDGIVLRELEDGAKRNIAARTGTRLDDPGQAVNAGYTSGSRSNPLYAAARNFKCLPRDPARRERALKERSQLETEGFFLFAAMWRLVQLKVPEVFWRPLQHFIADKDLKMYLKSTEDEEVIRKGSAAAIVASRQWTQDDITPAGIFVASRYTK
ncbi:hypothetical protein BT69DRAFT_1343403 [Atractiella rhizophila]|nr:hypothetical protein BT69DRAFT_1343403 [Atractiella rhizophila]